MKNKDRQLTSVKLDPELYREFQQACIDDKFTFQKLATSAMYLYLHDEEFKKRIQKPQ